MIKRLTLIFFVFVLAVAFYACDLGNSATTTATQEASTTAVPTTVTTTSADPTTTTTIPTTTVTEPPVSMPDDNTAWANYIVDMDYNYIADRLTKTQKSNVQKLCSAVGCKVSFEKNYTKVTDAKKNVVYYSKDFGEDTIILEPDFGALTLATRSKNETAFVYKGVTIYNFMSYIKAVEESGFSYSAVSSTDYMNFEGIFAGSDASGNSVIIKFTGNMIVIALTTEV